MDRTVREGMDVGVALRHVNRRAKGLSPAVADLPPNEVGLARQAARPTIKSRVKAQVRWLAKAAFRVSRPVLRPVVHRTLNVVGSEVAARLIPEIHQSSAVANHLAHLIREDMHGHIALLLQATQGAQDYARQESVGLAAEVKALLGSMDEAARSSTELRAVWELAHVRQATEIAHLRTVVEAMAGQLNRLEEYGYASVRRFALPVSNGSILVRTESGYLLVDEDDHAVLRSLVDSGDLEAGVRKLIERFLGVGDTFVDVGANVGVHTLCAARAMRGRGSIVAFEPFPRTCELLSKSILLNGFAEICEVHQAAVATQTGERELHLGKVSGHHSLIELDRSVSANGSTISVPVVRLDDVLMAGRRVDLLKIDVEGVELEVIAGARRIFTENPDIAVIVEFGPSHLVRAGHSPAEWLRTFDALGFDRRSIDPLTGELTQASVDELSGADSTNLFFLAATSSQWDRLTP
jgi:FkbM family methyltransferase